MESKGKTINIWIGLRASDFQMFDELVRIDKIVSIDTDDTKGISLISREFSTNKRTPWANEELLEVERLESFRGLTQELEISTKKINVFCYHNLPALERLVRKNKRIRLYAPPISLKRNLDDKLRFLNLLKSLKLKSIPSLTPKIKEANYHKLKKELGLPFVIKERVGASGRGSYFVRNKKDLMRFKKIIKTGVVITSKYIAGPSFNINAFVGKNVQLSQPSLQIIGLPECSSEKFTYCGNDFRSFNAIDKNIKNELYCITKKIGNKIKKKGFSGLFGIDFIYDTKNKILYPLEINPRFQGSTPLLTRYQRFKKRGRLTELYINSKTIPYNYSVNASFLLLHNIHGKKMIIKKSFNSGIYKFYFRNRRLSLNYLGNEDSFPKNKSEMLILGCPKLGAIVEPGAGILRIEFADSVLDSTRINLKKSYSELAKIVYKSLWETV